MGQPIQPIILGTNEAGHRFQNEQKENFHGASPAIPLFFLYFPQNGKPGFLD